jgi:MOSC domain-containing protein
VEVGTIASLWRYPVKALGAEALERVAVLPDGLAGDRTAALVVETPTHARAGKPFRGKESGRLHLTRDPQTAASYAADAGVLVTLDRSQPRWFDQTPISLLLDLWVQDVEALVGVALDPLRFRPNLYVRTAPGFVLREPDLVGAVVHAGSVALRVLKPTIRCVTPNYDVATGAGGPDVLRAVAQHRGTALGVYCEVITPGELALGDAVRLAP